MRVRRLVSARPRVGGCTAAELPAVIAMLEAEFVQSRGRSGPLGGRYPDLLSEANLDHIHVRRQGDTIVACCVARRATWLTGSERWQAAMIGFVHTLPAARGKGHAAALLEATVDALAAAGSDFVVLWSGLDGFYERLGWEAHDRGVFGSMTLAAVGTPAVLTIDSDRFETLRARSDSDRIVRDAAAYRALPLPVTAVGTLFASHGAHAAAALVGAAGDARYVYEAHGDDAALPALWRTITAGVTAVYVNESIGSPLHRWLARQVPIEFSGQQLAYWRMLSPRARRAAWRNWHIPYFDRI